jgi:hypothetical protein
MQIFAPLSVRLALFVIAIALVTNSGRSFAQGSAGGSIGNDEKALSRTRSAAPSDDASRNSRPEKKARQSTPARPNATAGAAGCTLVRTQTDTPGCYGYVGYSKGARVGWLRRNGMWVRNGGGEKCLQGAVSGTQIGRDSFRVADGTRIRLDAGCNNGQDF